MTIEVLSNKYGPFSSVVSMAGSVIAMGIALSLGWRGRTNWEPAEQDISRAPQKVGSLIAACAVALIWAELSEKSFLPLLTQIAVSGLVITVASLLLYGFLVNGLVYDKVISRTKVMKIIGGLWKTTAARKSQQENRVTTQELLAGGQYDPDRIWPRSARGLSKSLFVLGYLGLTVAGTVALGAVSIVVGLRAK